MNVAEHGPKINGDTYAADDDEVPADHDLRFWIVIIVWKYRKEDARQVNARFIKPLSVVVTWEDEGHSVGDDNHAE